jgi:hypothetical protein
MEAAKDVRVVVAAWLSGRQAILVGGVLFLADQGSPDRNAAFAAAVIAEAGSAPKPPGAGAA